MTEITLNSNTCSSSNRIRTVKSRSCICPRQALMVCQGTSSTAVSGPWTTDPYQRAGFASGSGMGYAQTEGSNIGRQQ